MDREEFETLMELAENGARTEWEHEFLDSLTQKALDPYWEPTERQWEKLEQIAGQG